ncbi:MAG TPA: hypothetical protein VIL32_07990 [Steroidobacteraceae bacterium]
MHQAIKLSLHSTAAGADLSEQLGREETALGLAKEESKDALLRP